MAGLDKLKKASNEMPFAPKKINIGEPTVNPIAETPKKIETEEPVKVEKTPTSGKEEKHKTETKAANKPKSEKKETWKNAGYRTMGRLQMFSVNIAWQQQILVNSMYL